MKRKRKILLVGFADDLTDVVAELDSTSSDIELVTEEAVDSYLPKAVDFVVYVMSTDTGFSSQFHSIFVYVHDHTPTEREYLMAIKDADISKIVFPEVSHLPQVSITDFRKTLYNSR